MISFIMLICFILVALVVLCTLFDPYKPSSSSTVAQLRRNRALVSRDGASQKGLTQCRGFH